MILADLLNISINLLLVVHVLVSLLLILVVLMQRPKQEGLGAAFGGGVTDSVFGAQTTNVLQKGTVYLGTLFMLLSLGLAILIGNRNHATGINQPDAPVVEEAPAVPGTTPGGGIVDDSEEVETPTPAESDPPAPTEEEAPAPTEEEVPVPTEEEAPAPTEDEAPAPTEEEVPVPTEEGEDNPQ